MFVSAKRDGELMCVRPAYPDCALTNGFKGLSGTGPEGWPGKPFMECHHHRPARGVKRSEKAEAIRERRVRSGSRTELKKGEVLWRE